MRTHTEVNFEKRGKLSDHRDCPIHAPECRCCCACNPKSKSILATIFLILLFFTSYDLARAAQAPTLDYDFEIFDIEVPGRPDLLVAPVDLNDAGQVISNIFFNQPSEVLILPEKRNRRGSKFGEERILFRCPGNLDTSATSINKSGAIAGSCLNDDGKGVGFVRYKNGQVRLLDFPGADGTGALGISDRGGFNDKGVVVGQFFGPLRNDHGGALSYRFHCFIWDGTFRQLDFFVGNTFVSCEGINSAGQVLMRYNTVDDQNNTIEAGTVIYDNGTFQLLALDLLAFGGAGQFFSDINELGQMPVQRSNTGNPDFDGLWFLDDGMFYRVPLPADWRLSSVEGINNKGQFVGVVRIPTGEVDTAHGNDPIFKAHGFLATPEQSARKIVRR